MAKRKSSKIIALFKSRATFYVATGVILLAVELFAASKSLPGSFFYPTKSLEISIFSKVHKNPLDRSKIYLTESENILTYYKKISQNPNDSKIPDVIYALRSNEQNAINNLDTAKKKKLAIKPQVHELCELLEAQKPLIDKNMYAANQKTQSSLVEASNFTELHIQTSMHWE